MVRDVSEISWGAGRQCSLFSLHHCAPLETGRKRGCLIYGLRGLISFLFYWYVSADFRWFREKGQSDNFKVDFTSAWDAGAESAGRPFVYEKRMKT
ncbi:hypothetical protein NPIL_156151 [Nephila pilipes]|uniref:Uncharacterized protein n=1 Tax=Nephila pilipes TaxID=299642 RepID=A0A8X6K525_NEPPI|nr:hypothetical protein NPIL_156151 [Nephila pilipes]